MREIKFRYRYKDFSTGKTFVRDFTLGEIESGAPYDEISDCPLMRGYKIVNPVVQYTGIKDRNGVDIYEGDLVEVRGIRLCEVIFHKEAGCWDLNLLSCKSSLPIGAVSPASWVYHAEVVGNKHENPELADSYGA